MLSRKRYFIHKFPHKLLGNIWLRKIVENEIIAKSQNYIRIQASVQSFLQKILSSFDTQTLCRKRYHSLSFLSNMLKILKFFRIFCRRLSVKKTTKMFVPPVLCKLQQSNRGNCSDHNIHNISEFFKFLFEISFTKGKVELDIYFYKL